jgi:hypothetical protein
MTARGNGIGVPGIALRGVAAFMAPYHGPRGRAVKRSTGSQPERPHGETVVPGARGATFPGSPEERSLQAGRAPVAPSPRGAGPGAGGAGGTGPFAALSALSVAGISILMLLP